MAGEDWNELGLRIGGALIRGAGQLRKTARRWREVADNAHYVRRQQEKPIRRYERAMQQGDDWTHTDPDEAGRPPVVKVARATDMGWVACSVTEAADACPVGCCRVWDAVPDEPMELLIMAAPGDEQNAHVTGLGAGDRVALRLRVTGPADA